MNKGLLNDLGWLWHLLVGLGITGAVGGALDSILYAWGTPNLMLILWVELSITVGLAVFGYVREKMQHDWRKLNTHQCIEALGWPLGGAIGMLGLLFLL